MNEEKIFDAKYVYLDWNPVLEGKEVFLAYTLPGLKRALALGGRVTAEKNDSDYPFITSGGAQYALAYYDPNYEVKLAYIHGKVIQYRDKAGNDNWRATNSPSWSDDCEYRVVEGYASECCQSCDYSQRTSKEEPCYGCTRTESSFKGSNWKPKKRRMTNRELAQWLAKGNGELWDSHTGHNLIRYGYVHSMDSEPCCSGIFIRGWNEDDWHEPEVEG